MTWKADDRHRKASGPFEMVPERNADSETAHLITFPDGRQIRVLPDGSTSGQKRSKVVVEALEVCQALTDGTAPLAEGLDPQGVTYQVVLGYLAYHELSWEYVGEDGTLVDGWLAGWFGRHPDPLDNPHYVVDFLGWEIVREGSE